ncbi:hypothetical protein [Noviherbaspirillum sp.]|uniref:hypothetical protein n=1 Tax=Noviherbaspirillum sp. TaxID=1926288 RepID=UPI002D3546BA|nr:hypothetical protein [Noviherbaspirillum sp.]HZW23215.1 hypothetical protein [Noviherbaspirillum sp.]
MGMLVLLPVLLLVPAARHTIESRMALHMLLEFPLLFASGYAAMRIMEQRMRHWLALDHLGITGLTAASCVFAFWMIPAALDAALLDPAMAAAKYLSWWLAGFAAANALRRATIEIRIFFLGNAAWMSATAGLLYLDATSRLCVSYLFGDQETAGRGLVLLACLLAFLAIRGPRARGFRF